MIKKKVIMSCNTNLVPFLIETNPTKLTNMTKLGGQYYAVHPTSQVQKELLFQAFAFEGGSEIADDEVDAYAAQSFSRTTPQQSGRETDGVFLRDVPPANTDPVHLSNPPNLMGNLGIPAILFL